MSMVEAAAYVNTLDTKLAKSLKLSPSTLQRYCAALPEDLRYGSEGQLLAWMQEYDSGRRRDLSAAFSGSRLFTPLEEQLVAQWMCVMARVNVAVGRAGVIQRAREVLLLRGLHRCADLRGG
jgi:hypothetical protein